MQVSKLKSAGPKPGAVHAPVPRAPLLANFALLARLHRLRGTQLRNRSDHLAVEGRKVVRLAAADEVAVADDLAVLPVGAGIAHFILQRRPRGDAAAVHQSGGNEQPAAMADHRDRFAGPVHLLSEL